MAVSEAPLIGRRYSLIRQLGGNTEAPLYLATDLRRSTTIVLRLFHLHPRLGTHFTAPLLAPPPNSHSQGPILPYDFGIDGSTAYLARPYASGISLAKLLEHSPPSPSQLISCFHQAIEALEQALTMGFEPYESSLDHILLTNEGRICVISFDHALDTWGIPPSDTPERHCLRSIRRAFATYSPGELPRPIHHLLQQVDYWLWTAPPSIDQLHAELDRCERRCSPEARWHHKRIRSIANLCSNARQLKAFAPLAQPYLLVLATLVTAIGISSRTLSGSMRPHQVIVRPAPTTSPSPTFLHWHPQISVPMLPRSIAVINPITAPATTLTTIHQQPSSVTKSSDSIPPTTTSDILRKPRPQPSPITHPVTTRREVTQAASTRKISASSHSQSDSNHNNLIRQPVEHPTNKTTVPSVTLPSPHTVSSTKTTTLATTRAAVHNASTTKAVITTAVTTTTITQETTTPRTDTAHMMNSAVTQHTTIRTQTQAAKPHS